VQYPCITYYSLLHCWIISTLSFVFITDYNFLVKFCHVFQSLITSFNLILVQVFLSYYNCSLVRDDTSTRIVQFGAVARILGGLKPNFSNIAPKVMYYSSRGPDPEDTSLANADILKPNVIAPGNSIWGAWSSFGLDSAEFLG
jgi:hypothetical protein